MIKGEQKTTDVYIKCTTEKFTNLIIPISHAIIRIRFIAMI